jgi:hypothetical protein
MMNKKIENVLSKGAKWWAWSLHGDLIVYEYGMVVPGGPYQHIQQHSWASTLPSFRRPHLISKTQVQLVSTNPLVPTKTALPWKPFTVQQWKLCVFAYMLNPGLHFLHFYIEPFNFLAAKLSPQQPDEAYNTSITPKLGIRV